MLQTPTKPRDDLAALFAAGAIGGLPDADLLARFASGRRDAAAEAAFRILVDRHGPMVLGVCRRVLGDSHSADDAFQATFLVLVRKAGSVRVEGSLGRWLHGVSRRVASRARSGIRAERSALDRLRPPEPSHDPDPIEIAELRRVIDEEIGRLPARYRSAVVLCDLEGLTQEQAAGRLLCPVGTIQSRLHRARGKLREALARRGFAPAALGAATLAAATARAEVPPRLASAILGMAIEGVVPSAVWMLVGRELRRPLMVKLVGGGIGLIAVLGAVVFATQAPAGRGGPQATAPAKQGAAPKAKADPVPLKNRVLEGVVLDPTGQPVDGATVVAGLPHAGRPNHRVLATDAEGRFAWPIPDGDASIFIAAHHGDLAPATRRSYYPADKRPELLELKLKVAEPISAVLVNGEGHPVAGAKVRIDQAATRSEESKPDARGMTSVMTGYTNLDRDVLAGSPIEGLFEAETDPEGRFTLKSAPGSYLKLSAKAADGSMMRASAEAKGGGLAPPILGLDGFVLLQPGEPRRLIATPTAKIAGRVTTAMPGEKVAGLTIFIQESHAEGVPRRGNMGNVPVVPVGADGRFTIENLDEGTVNVFVNGDGLATRWTFRAGRDVPLIPGKTAEVAIELIPGVIAEGTVVDEAGKPVEGAMVGAYGPMHPRSGAATRSDTTDARGRYRHRVPSGGGYFYVMNMGDRFRRLPGTGSSRTVTIPEGEATVTIPPIAVEATVPLHGKVVDAKGKPIAGVDILGVDQREGSFMKGPGVSVTPAGVTDDRGEFRLKLQNHSAPPGKPTTLQLRRKGGKEVEVQVTPDADGAVTVELPDED